MDVNVTMCVCKYIVSLMRATPLTPSQRSAFVQRPKWTTTNRSRHLCQSKLRQAGVGDADQSPACIQDDEETESLGKT